jgi:hypothetical protein
MCNGTIEERRLLTCTRYLPTKGYMVMGSCLGWPNGFLSLHTYLALMEIFRVMWIFCNFILSPETIKNLLFEQHLSKLAENFEYSITHEQLGPAMFIKIRHLPLLMMISMQQRMKKQAWIFATTHWKDFSNSILFWNYFHATFLPFITAYGPCLQVILMRVVWQSYGTFFTTTIPHTMKKG